MNYNLILLKSIEKLDDETGDNIATKIVSDPLLDKDQLSSVLQDALLGTHKNKKTGEIIKLKKETIMKGLLNLIDRL